MTVLRLPQDGLAAVRFADGRAGLAMRGLAVAGAWAMYLPLGSKYLVYLLLGAVSLGWISRTSQWRAALRSPLAAVPLAMWLMLALSATWSAASFDESWTSAWHYGRLLFMPFIAMACPPLAARKGMRHFVLASALVAGLTVLDRFHPLPAHALWSSTVQALGNQRIATSLLLAIGVSFALVEAADLRTPVRQRLLWLAAAVFIAVALTLQDRRTGMVALPVLLAALALSRQRSWWRGTALLGGVVLLALLTWHQSDTVRARFAEGVHELRTYRSDGEIATSWGMRVRMIELTLQMVKDRPIAGHGLASWVGQWHQRAQGGGKLLEEQLTPHNEYLLIAEQAGLIGLLLWLAVLATYLRSAWQAGPDGSAALMVWVAIAWSAVFNVAVRDAKFALPLFLLSALALAASARLGADNSASPAQRPRLEPT